MEMPLGGEAFPGVGVGRGCPGSFLASSWSQNSRGLAKSSLLFFFSFSCSVSYCLFCVLFKKGKYFVNRWPNGASF